MCPESKKKKKKKKKVDHNTVIHEMHEKHKKAKEQDPVNHACRQNSPNKIKNSTPYKKKKRQTV
jgi:hypothetical protein